MSERSSDANMLEHPYRAAIEAGAKVLRQFRDTNLDLYTDKEIVWLVYCSMKAESPAALRARAILEGEGQMLSLEEQKKLPWCDCDFRATGTWNWCASNKKCLGRKLRSRSNQVMEDDNG